MLKITVRSIIEEFERRNIPFEIIDERFGIVRYKVSPNCQLLRSSTVMSASRVGALVGDHKHLTHSVLRDVPLQVPTELIYKDDKSAETFLDQYKPIVVKPADGGHGNGVSVGVKSVSQLKKALEVAKRSRPSGQVLMQQQVMGEDLRVLIIGGRLAAAAIRQPASVTGDGIRNVRQLIAQENATNPDRGKNYTTRLNYIDEAAAERYLGTEALDKVIPEAGEVFRVAGPANIGAGGTSTDVTEEIPDSIISSAVAVAETLSLPVCGVDFMVTDINDPATYTFIEVNSCPSFGLHLQPSIGSARPVAKMFVDMLLVEAT